MCVRGQAVENARAPACAADDDLERVSGGGACAPWALTCCSYALWLVILLLHEEAALIWHRRPCRGLSGAPPGGSQVGFHTVPQSNGLYMLSRLRFISAYFGDHRLLPG